MTIAKPPTIIPPDHRQVRFPLAAFCANCDNLTRNGGGCPGCPPPAADASGGRPMCHSVYAEYYDRQMMRSRQ